MSVRSRVMTALALLGALARRYPYAFVPFVVVLVLTSALLAVTGGASYVAPFFYAIF